MVLHRVPSETPSTPSSLRRTFLASASTVGIGSLAGCSTVDTLLGDGVEPPERQVPANWTPNPGDWPTEQYGFARTGHNPFASPPREEPSAVWTEDVSTLGGNFDNLIVAGGWVLADLSGTVVALDPETGEQGWRWSTQGNGGNLEYVMGRVYAGNGDGIVALDSFDGELVWSTRLGDFDVWDYDLVEREGWVFLFGPDEVRCLHADTGEVVDRLEHEGLHRVATDGSVLYGGDRVFSALAVDDRRLERRWENDYPGYETTDSPVVDDGLVYRGGYRVFEDDDLPQSRLTVYDTNHRHGVQTVTVPFDQGLRTPAVADGTAYVATADVRTGTLRQDGVVAAVTHDGEVQWRFQPDADPRSPVVADGTVYTGPYRNLEDSLVALDAETGEELWRRPVNERPELAVAGETLYVATDGEVRALRA